MKENTIDTQLIFNSCADEGLEKNEIILAFVEAGMDVVGALREYGKLAREAGLTMSRAEKAEKIQNILADCDLTTQQSVNEAAEGLSEAMEFSLNTARLHVKNFAEEHGIVLSVFTKKARLASREEVVGYLIENEVLDNPTIMQGLCDEFGYKQATAASLMNMYLYMKEYHKQQLHGEAKKNKIVKEVA